MGRRGGEPSLQNRISVLRTMEHLSQQELAQRAGLTRQTVNAIEGGRYVPNTSVSLRLAHALGCRVEDLFHLDDTSEERPVHSVVTTEGISRRVVLAQVGHHLVAHPLVGDRALQEGFASADAVLTDGGENPSTRSPQAESPLRSKGRRPSARLLVSPERLERTAVLLGCDPSLAVVTAHVSRRSYDARLVWISASSRQALDAVARGEAHLAGSHLRDPEGGYNVVHARETLARSGGLVVTFASWEQGFVVREGNPKAIRTASDLLRPDVHVVNREVGAGCRQLLDELLTKEGVLPQRVSGYSQVANSHMAVARAIANGAADVGLALRAAADVYGLDFVPLSYVRFDLVIPGPALDHPAVAILLEVLQGKALRDEVGALPGYDVGAMGSVAASIPAAA